MSWGGRDAPCGPRGDPGSGRLCALSKGYEHPQGGTRRLVPRLSKKGADPLETVLKHLKDRRSEMVRPLSQQCLCMHQR